MYREYRTIEELFHDLEIDEERNFRQRVGGQFDKFNSSYLPGEFYRLFYALVAKVRPQRYVELGVLGGYSLAAVALARSELGSPQEVIAYDLFEDYAYNSETQANVRKNLRSLGLLDQVRLVKANILEENIIQDELRRADIVHCDMSNDGELIESIFKQVDVSRAFIMVLEGGSSERDEVEWMQQYERKKMRPVLQALGNQDVCDVLTVSVFPSLSIIATKSSKIKAKTV